MTCRVTVLIHTLNEEANLPSSLASVVGWADQVIVVDSESQDDTVKIAKQAGAEVAIRKCNRAGLVEQRNWALASLLLRNAWVLILDADERPSAQLKKEIEMLTDLDDPACDGYWCRLKLFFMDRWIAHASMYPTWTMRVFRHAVVRYEEREVNAHPAVAPRRAGFLRGHVENHDKKGFEAYLRRLDEFSSLEARAYLKARGQAADNSLMQGALLGRAPQRRRYLKHLFIRMPARPLLLFVYLYIVRRGVLDGREGFDYCVLKAVIEWATGIKMREIENAQRG